MATLYNRTIGTITDSGDTLTLRLICTYTQTSQNNTSAISIYVRAECSANDWPYKVSSWQITGNSITGSGGESTATTGTRNMSSKSKTVTHNSSGNYSFSSGAKVTVIYWDSVNGTWGTKSFTLSNASYQPATIDVYSSLAFSPSPATMGSNVTMTITKKSSSAFTATGVKITAEYDGTSVAVYEGTGASTTWNVPDLATTTTDSESKAITIKVQSIRDGVYYAAKEYTLTANVPSTYVPGITIGTITDNIGFSSFVAGYSKLTISLTGSVSSDGGASISGYSIIVRDTNASGSVLYTASATTSSSSQSFTMNVPIASASTHITAIIADSRGRTTTATRTVSAVAYSQPQISIAANRCDSGGTSDPLGAYVKISVTWSITQIGTSNTVDGNVITYKSTNGTSYSSADSRTASGYSGTYSFVTALATMSQGWFYTTIKDKVSGQVTSPIKMVPKATIPLSLFDDGNGVGATLGQIASGSGFNIYMPTKSTEQIKTSFKDSVAMGSYGSAQQTLENLCNEVRFSSGCMGSASITTAVTAYGVTIPASWYNYIFAPHRSGGVNGQASGDNCNYGTLILMGMTATEKVFFVRISGASPYYNSIIEMYHRADTRTDTYYIGGLAALAYSTTQLRVQIPIPPGYTSVSIPTQTFVQIQIGYGSALTYVTPTACEVLDVNPSSVLVQFTVSGLTANRGYVTKNGSVQLTLS